MRLQREGTPQASVHDLKDARRIIDVFQAHGHNQIDTARVYGAGSSEEYLGQLHLDKEGFLIDTKFYPVPKADPDRYPGTIKHTKEVRVHIM